MTADADAGRATGSAPARDDGPEIILDLSRLLSRVLHSTPTGVDRVEMAYARGLRAMAPSRLRYAAVHPSGLYGRLPSGAVERFLDLIEARWQEQHHTSYRSLRPSAIRAFLALRPRFAAIGSSPGRPVFVQASPHHLTDRRVIASILRRERARFVCLVHDLIPLQYPEYARVGGAALHERRMRTLAAYADGLICNSHATRDALLPLLRQAGRGPRVAVAHLGTDVSAATAAIVSSDRPYFVCIGTIEPRKNHLLLLNLWRRWSEREGPGAIPRLLVIGRRGWENEQIVDMLDRCPALKGCVEEHAGLPDRTVREVVSVL